MLLYAFSFLCTLIHVGFTWTTIGDPSDYVNLANDAEDNAIKADYNVPLTMYLKSPLKATHSFTTNESALSISYETISATDNDTNVILVGNGAQLNMSFVNIYKQGYFSDLAQASFFGVNAAINVQNGSRSYFDHLNVITHNGASNVYSYGNGSYVYVENSVLYSSGPAAHGLYAGGYGTIVGNYINHYSGGNRCSSFSGDLPASYVAVFNSIAHTSGIGSAIFYALGTITAANVTGHAKRSPTLFSDGPSISTFINCHLTAGLLGGTVIHSIKIRQKGAMVSFINSKLTTLGNTMPALWFGNIIAIAYLYKTVINTTSGILVTANYSQITQEFNYYAGYADNSNLLPAIVTVTVVQCNLNGSLIAYNGSSISWILTQYSNWSGDAYSGYEQLFISVSLDLTSTWTLTGNTALQNISSAVVNLTNIISNGYNITYDSSSTANDWLNESIMSLIGGGQLVPDSLLQQKQEQQQSLVAASSAFLSQKYLISSFLIEFLSLIKTYIYR
ncbi:unnamed protein product [Adineta ricciae]|uniref:Uncharacterized protein n=1 Tax=Adineta ricciae TaxID=249248 RepID=A0A815N8C7_ADIRI|nr:unnamed protein product [Adineta ricciae]